LTRRPKPRRREPMEIEADFRTDLCNWCREALQRNGYKVRTRVKDKVTKKLGAEAVEDYYYVIQYFNVEHRFIKPKPRKVVKHTGFTCPEADAEGLETFLEKVENGGELMRHASTKIMKADYADALLNDWYIHHFHLGLTIGKKGFIKRTKNVLFAIVTHDAVCCIGVQPHDDDHGKEPWSQKSLLRVVHEHWPFLMEQWRLLGVLGSTEQPTDEEIQKLRDAGVVVPLQMPDGAVYAPIGGGYATSLDSGQAVARTMLYLKTVTAGEKWLRENIDEVASWAATQGKTLPVTPKFKLRMTEDALFADEDTAEITVRLGERP
jgi:hypothetical protein